METFLDKIGWDKAMGMMAEATRRAAQEALDAGLPVTFSDNGKLYRRFPDGHVEPVTTDSSGSEA